MKGLIFSFKYALEGLIHVIRYERNFRIHLVAMTTVYYLASFYCFKTTEMVLLNITICLVLFGELVNTAIETLVDLVTSEYHNLAKKAKDVAAAAVLINAGAAVVTAVFLFGKIEVLRKIWTSINSNYLNYIYIVIYIVLAVLFIFGYGGKRR